MSMMPIRGIIGGRRPTSASTLLTDLVAWYDMDETSGTRYDAHNSYDLTDVNTVGYGTGQTGNAADFEADNTTEALYNQNAKWYNMRTADFTYVMWVKLETVGTNRVIDVSDPGGDFVFNCGIEATYIYVIPNGVNGTAAVVHNVTINTGTWYMLIIEYTHSTGTWSLSLNNDTPTTSTVNGQLKTPTGSAGNFRLTIGQHQNLPRPLDGLVDQYVIWERVLTSQEKPDLYASGSGIGGYPG